MFDAQPMTALWGAVIGAGLYHGINPGMGWPLAVSAALMDNKPSSLRKALIALAIGHFIAMLLVLLPFSLMSILVEWNKEIRIGAGFVVIAMGIYLLINRKHPRFLARVKPSRLALWSFLAAIAHGAGLMLVPIFLMMSDVSESATANIAAAAIIAGAHTLAMAVACGLIAFIVYYWLGLKFLTRTWFNLDLVWALSLVLVGVVGVYGAWSGGMNHT